MLPTLPDSFPGFTIIEICFPECGRTRLNWRQDVSDSGRFALNEFPGGAPTDLFQIPISLPPPPVHNRRTYGNVPYVLPPDLWEFLIGPPQPPAPPQPARQDTVDSIHEFGQRWPGGDTPTNTLSLTLNLDAQLLPPRGSLTWSP